MYSGIEYSCPECKSSDIRLNDREGEATCWGCGVVVADGLIDTRPENHHEDPDSDHKPKQSKAHKEASGEIKRLFKFTAERDYKEILLTEGIEAIEKCVYALFKDEVPLVLTSAIEFFEEVYSFQSVQIQNRNTITKEPTENKSKSYIPDVEVIAELVPDTNSSNESVTTNDKTEKDIKRSRKSRECAMKRKIHEQGDSNPGSDADSQPDDDNDDEDYKEKTKSPKKPRKANNTRQKVANTRQKHSPMDVLIAYSVCRALLKMTKWSYVKSIKVINELRKTNVQLITVLQLAEAVDKYNTTNKKTLLSPQLAPPLPTLSPAPSRPSPSM